MSEDIAYSVEDGGTPPPDNTPAPEPQAEAAAPEPAAEPEPAAPDVEVDGQKMVPLAALQAERENVRSLKERAARADQLETEWRNAQPYVQFLRDNPDLLKPRQAAPTPQAPPPEADPELVNLARTLDLYTPEGQPDAKRAAALASFVDTRSGKQAQEAVRPMAEMSVRERAAANLREAKNQVLPNGARPDPAILDQIWKQADPSQMADPNVAAAAYILAAGMGTFHAPAAHAAPAAPAQAPVVTESAGRVAGNRAPVSEFEQRVASIRGISPQKYAGYVRDFKSGAPNALED